MQIFFTKIKKNLEDKSKYFMFANGKINRIERVFA